MQVPEFPFDIRRNQLVARLYELLVEYADQRVGALQTDVWNFFAKVTAFITPNVYFFTTDESHYLVDLPGYGFANAPLPVVEKWQRLLKQYLSGRQSLRRAFVLIDSRHGVKKVDEEILSLLDSSAVTFQCIMTKADKIKDHQMNKVLDQVRGALSKHPAAFPEIIVTSSEKGVGIDTLRSTIAHIQ